MRFHTFDGGAHIDPDAEPVEAAVAPAD